MFSSQEYLDRKTGSYGVGRLSYLQSLVTEFQDTSDEEAKEQVLANLANFAYDPINYEHFKKLNVLDLFLDIDLDTSEVSDDCLEESNGKLVEFAIGGLCNCCLDRSFKKHIMDSGGIDLVIKCLSRPEEQTVMSAITTLMYMCTPESRQAVTTLPVVECMLRFSECNNKLLANLAQVFLQDYCTENQINEARAVQRKMTLQFSSEGI